MIKLLSMKHMNHHIIIFSLCKIMVESISSHFLNSVPLRHLMEECGTKEKFILKTELKSVLIKVYLRMYDFQFLNMLF